MYYVNMGRWADAIIGPFADYEVAKTYAKNIGFNGGGAQVAVLAPPDEDRLDAAVNECNSTFYVTLEDYTRDGTSQVKLVELAPSGEVARRQAHDRMTQLTNRTWRHVATVEV
jgi:hypothetical protein